jgi:RNA polymerase sigma-70 factor (ECF subfamily)
MAACKNMQIYFCTFISTSKIALHHPEGTMSNSKERQLVAQCLCGCQSSWRQLYVRIEKTVSYIVRWRQWGLNQAQMEETVQEVLNSFISSLETFDFNCSLETFASTITKNKCVSEIRKQSAAKRAGERFAVSVHGYDSVAAPGETNERRLLLTEEHHQVVLALGQLGEKCRTILRMRYYDEYSYKQIGEILNIPAGTVASRLKRSLLQLKKAWEESTEEV